MPRKVRGKLIVYEDLLVKGSGQALPRESDQLRLVLGKLDARVQLVRGYNVGAFITVIALEKFVERDRQIEARHDVDVRQEHVVRLAVLARQVSHVVLRIDVPYPPIGLLAGYAARELVESGFRFGTIDKVRQLEDAWLPLGRTHLRHGHRKDHSLPDGLVASSQVHQVTLHNLELLVAGGVERHGHRSGPVQRNLHQRVQLLHGALRGQAHPVRLRQLCEPAADQDRVEGTVYPSGIPSAELNVQLETVSVR